jgi:hypothetical protein
MKSSSFQSIYTSLLTNEIILKELNEKRKMKMNFIGGTNQIGKDRMIWKEKKNKEERRETEKRHKRDIRTIKFTSHTRTKAKLH